MPVRTSHYIRVIMIDRYGQQTNTITQDDGTCATLAMMDIRTGYFITPVQERAVEWFCPQVDKAQRMDEWLNAMAGCQSMAFGGHEVKTSLGLIISDDIKGWKAWVKCHVEGR